MIAAPWDVAPPHEQLFVLVTGANSGVGLGICERLIDEFLATRSLTSHLILVPTTRSARKSAETVTSLRRHLRRTATSSRALRSRAGAAAYDPEDTLSRVHLLAARVDLCDLVSVYACAATLVAGHLSDPTDPSAKPYRIPRLDTVIFNAGIGGWTGLDWAGLFTDVVTKGIPGPMTWPTFKVARPGVVVSQKPVRSYVVSPAAAAGDENTEPALGEVFCANVFGHYVLAHELLPLLSRPAAAAAHSPSSPVTSPGRVVWTSSIEARGESFDPSDFQGIATRAPYESSKRLTDVLSLTSHLPSARRVSAAYFSPEDPETASALPVRPSFYLAHPGIVASTLFPLPFPFLFFWAYKFALYLARWLGSPWHTVTWYAGAVAPVWLALQDDETLAELDAERVKWGSAASASGRAHVKKTEVEGWGWQGAVEDRESLARDPATGVLRKAVGRHPEARDLTPESLVEFEQLGVEAWGEMERLRRLWEGILGIRGGAATGAQTNGKS